MKRILFFLVLGFSGGSIAAGQHMITGSVTDAKSGQPLSLVNILAIPEQSGTTTDEDGNFSLPVVKFPVTVQFTHIAYEPESITFSKAPAKPVQISMVPRIETIREVVVEGGKYVQIMRRENFYVTDYEFDQDKIWVLGYAGKSILDPQLVILGLDGQIIDRKPAKRQSGFFKDAFGHVYLTGKGFMATADYGENGIRVGPERELDGWEQNLFDLQMVLGNSAIFKWTSNQGLIQEFAVVDFRDTTVTVVHKSYDRELFTGEQQARAFRHSPIPTIFMGSFGMGGDRSSASFDPSDAFTARAQEQLDYRPVKARIFRFRNSFLIFEDRGCHLWKYGTAFLDPEDLQIRIPDNAKNIDMMQDPISGRLFLHYTLSGSDYLAGIDPYTGTILTTRHLEGFHAVENIKVYNNRIWFTHQNMIGQTLMNLYSTEIGED